MIRIDTGNMSSSLGKSGGGGLRFFFIYTKFYSQKSKGIGQQAYPYENLDRFSPGLRVD